MSCRLHCTGVAAGLADLGRPLERVATFRSVVTNEGWGTATERARDVAGRAMTRLRRRVNDGQVRVVDKAAGSRRADAYFWNGLARNPGWMQVQERLELLDSTAPEQIAHFVETSLERTSDPMVVLGLVRHPLSVEPAERWILAAWEGHRRQLADRVRHDRLLGAAFGAAVAMLLPKPLADDVLAWVEEQLQVLDLRGEQLIDSLGYCLATSERVLVRPCANRVVIAEHFGDVDSLGLYSLQADRISVIATSDTFGRADFSKFASYPNVGPIEVEHIRTRIPRFSQAYVELHEATAEVARVLTSRLYEFEQLAKDDLRPVLEIATADFLFFQALKVRAIEELLSDDTVDDIVIAVGGRQRSGEFLRLLRSIDGLLDDPRVRLVSSSRSGPERAAFWEIIAACRSDEPTSEDTIFPFADDHVIERFHRDVRGIASAFDLPVGTSRPSLLFCSAASSAYVDSVVGYVDALADVGDVSVLCLGSGGQVFEQALRTSTCAGVSELAPSGNRFDALSEMLRPALAVPLPQAGATPAQRSAWVAQRLSAHRFGREVVGPLLATAEALARRMEIWRDEGRLPDGLLICPQRTVWVTAAAVVARRFGVPSLSLESHAQDANYSRYIKVVADYYGVLAPYFASQVATEFGIAADRIRTVGSPRQVAPAGYDPMRAQHEAIDALPSDSPLRADRLRVAFFCQPSAWGHVRTIWTTLLRAADAADCIVLLKTHPEESVSRVRLYLDRASEIGLGHRVVVVSSGPEDTIALADIVVTAYSAAAFDAVVRQNPVISLTDGDLEYPVDLPAILGVPMARSVEDLVMLFEEFRADPAAARRRAAEVLERQPQWIDGPRLRLQEFVDDMLAAGPSGIRSAADLPTSLFLDGPHPVFPV